MTTLSHSSCAEWWRPETPAATRLSSRPESGSGLPFWALMALTAVMLLSPQTFVPLLATLRIALMTAVIAAVAYVADSLRHGRRVVTVGREMRWCLALLAWAVVTLPFSRWPGGSINLLLDLYLKSIIVFWLLGGIVQSAPRLRQVVWGLSLITVPLALTGIAHFSAGDFYPSNLAVEPRILGYDAGLARNPNDLALLLALVLPMTVALLFCEHTLRYRVVLAAIICVDVADIIATFSRSGFIALGVTLVLYLWRIRRQRGSRWMWLGVALALVALPLLPGTYVQRLSTIVDKDADPTGSAQARWNDQVVAAGYVLEHPFVGAGVGMDVLVMNDLRGAKWRQVHDMYLEYAVDLGVPGVVLFLALFRSCMKAVTTVQQRCAGAFGAESVLNIAQGIWIGLASFAVAAFFYPIAYHVYFYYVGGLAVATRSTCDAMVTS